MSVTFNDNKRQIIPRWFSFEKAREISNLNFSVPNEALDFSGQLFFKEKLEDWLQYKKSPYAEDLVGSALMSGDLNNDDVKKACIYILKNDISDFAKEIAGVYLAGENTPNGLNKKTCENVRLESQLNISKVRRFLNDYPRNPILWSDLSYHYALIGMNDKSEKAMDIAVRLAPYNPYILRAASRCYWHLGDPEKGLYFIRKSSSTKEIPSLVSTEIAISELLGKRSSLVKTGRNLLGLDVSPGIINELAGTLATLEYSAGSNKRAKELVGVSLQDPNENTVAQVEWLSKGLNLDYCAPKDLICTFEADSRRALRFSDYKKAFENSWKWLEYQPFSSRPAVLGSYIASVCMRDFSGAIEMLDRSLCSSPDDPLLLNNLAFSHASIGDVEKAEKYLSMIHFDSLNTEEQLVLCATQGLIFYRQGEHSKGKEFYRRAIVGFEKTRQENSSLVAQLFLGREEVRVGNIQEGLKILEKVKMKAKNQGVNEINKQAEYYMKKE